MTNKIDENLSPHGHHAYLGLSASAMSNDDYGSIDLPELDCRLSQHSYVGVTQVFSCYRASKKQGRLTKPFVELKRFSWLGWRQCHCETIYRAIEMTYLIGCPLNIPIYRTSEGKYVAGDTDKVII